MPGAGAPRRLSQESWNAPFRRLSDRYESRTFDPVQRGLTALLEPSTFAHCQGIPIPAEEGAVMRHHHPILVLAIMGGLLLAIAGGPVAFVLLVMASPLIIIMIFSVHGVLHGGGGISQAGYQRGDARVGDGFRPDKT